MSGPFQDRRFELVEVHGALANERLAQCRKWSPGFQFGLTDLEEGPCHMWAVEIDGEWYAGAVLASAGMVPELLLQAQESVRAILRRKIPPGQKVPDDLLSVDEQVERLLKAALS